MRLLFTRHLLLGMNEKFARCNFDLLNFESFRSKRPIELINVQVSVILRIWNDIPKRPNSFYWAKRKTTICVRNGLMLLWNFFACFIFVPCVDLLDVWQTWLENCQSFSIVRFIYECNLISYTYVFAHTERSNQ